MCASSTTMYLCGWVEGWKEIGQPARPSIKFVPAFPPHTLHRHTMYNTQYESAVGNAPQPPQPRAPLGRPPQVRQHRGVQHVGVRQQQRRRVPHRLALRLGGVPIVGIDARWWGGGWGVMGAGGGSEGAEGRELVLRERLGGEDEEGLVRLFVVVGGCLWWWGGVGFWLMCMRWWDRPIDRPTHPSTNRPTDR